MPDRTKIPQAQHILLTFFTDTYFLYFIATPALLSRVEAVKSLPVHSIRDVICPILKDCSKNMINKINKERRRSMNATPI
jgi:hypothetical protein